MFVAEYQNHLVGLIHGSLMIRLTSIPFLEIVALVVKDENRRQGIGRLLVEAVEKHCNCERIRVHCNIKRTEAHQFYSLLNYDEIKNQKVFEKYNLLVS